MFGVVLPATNYLAFFAKLPSLDKNQQDFSDKEHKSSQWKVNRGTMYYSCLPLSSPTGRYWHLSVFLRQCNENVISSVRISGSLCSIEGQGPCPLSAPDSGSIGLSSILDRFGRASAACLRPRELFLIQRFEKP